MKHFLLAVLLIATPAFADDYTREEVKQLQRNAQDGDAAAQYDLAMAYHDGAPGLQQNDRDAIKWFTKSAQQGEVRAQFNLAIGYYRGIGVKKNVTQAVKWFKRAAEQGNPDAAHALAAAYSKGVGGLEKDNAQAYYWLMKAKDGHVRGVDDDIQSLTETMTPNETKQAQALLAKDSAK